MFLSNKSTRSICFMMTSSNGNIFRVTGPLCGEFTGHRWILRVTGTKPVTRSFDVFFDLRMNKRLSKQSWGWWFETPSRPLWRHCNALVMSASLCRRQTKQSGTLGVYCSRHDTKAHTSQIIVLWIRNYINLKLWYAITHAAHIEAETKWPPFSRRNFQMFFHGWKWMNFDKISLKFVPKSPINNIPALVQIMAWRRLGGKPLPEAMMVRLRTHITITAVEVRAWMSYIPHEMIM